MLNFERGLAACDAGQTGLGLLWFVESLHAATEGAQPDRKHAALSGLSVWRRDWSGLKGVFSHDELVVSVVFSRDGKTILTGSWDRTAQLWDTATREPIGSPLRHHDSVEAVALSGWQHCPHRQPR